MQRIVAWLIAAMVFGWAARAAAQDKYGVVTLDLRPTSGEMPTHLCVVSESKSPRARDRLWDLLVDEPEQVGAAGASTSTLWRVLPKAWSGEPDSGESQKCADGIVGDCRPRVQLPPGLTKANDFFAACTYDTLADGGATDDPRPLFVLLEHLEGAPPHIESIRLTGGVATIGVGADLDRVVVTARSLGGAYLPHRRSERGIRDNASEGSTPSGPRDVVVLLSLVARCQSTELMLPRTTLQPEDRERLAVRAHGVELDVDKCVGPLVGSEVLQVRLPQAPLGVGTIDVELAARPGRPGARFGGRYDGAWPRAPFPLKFKQVSFSWRRPACTFPHDECPSVTLDNGTTCVATPTKAGCDYLCPGLVDDGAVDLELPVRVTFEKESPVQRWDDTLARAGQTLSSYVKADEIHLDANVNAWETEVPDNQISQVELFGEDGTARRYGVTHVPNLQLKVPGASCEPVRFRPIGDRHYDEGLAEIRDGEIQFGAPHRLARRIGFSVTLAAGGGPTWSTFKDDTKGPPLYFSGLGMFAIEIRPRPPKLARVALEIRVGGTLGRYGTVVETDEDQTDDGQTDDPDTTCDESVPDDCETSGSTTGSDTGWARLLLEPGLVISAHQRVAIGMGLGLGVALPFRSRQDLFGDGLRFIVSPNVDLRFRIRKYLKLVLQLRGVLREQLIAQGDPTDEPTTKDRAGSFMTLFGLQATF